MKKAKSIFLKHKNGTIHLLRFGEGPEPLIAFHGYSDHAAIFLPLEETLASRYTVFSIDLPYHGQTEWSDTHYSRQDVANWIEQILEREGKDSFALLGYSYGGRVVQRIARDFEHKISRIFLLAPDGIYTRGMINAHLVPRIIRLALKNAFNRPQWFLAIVERFNRLGLLSNFNLKFMNFHLSSLEGRERLFNTWLSMNDFVLRPAKTKRFFRRAKIPVHLYFGRRDQAIPLRAGKWMARDIAHINLHILEKGHRVISPELIERMEADLKKAEP